MHGVVRASIEYPRKKNEVKRTRRTRNPSIWNNTSSKTTSFFQGQHYYLSQRGLTSHQRRHIHVGIPEQAVEQRRKTNGGKSTVENQQWKLRLQTELNTGISTLVFQHRHLNDGIYGRLWDQQRHINDGKWFPSTLVGDRMPPRNNKKEAARWAKEHEEICISRAQERRFIADMLHDQFEAQHAMLIEQYEQEIKKLKAEIVAKDTMIESLQQQLQDQQPNNKRSAAEISTKQTHILHPNESNI
jgi:hypothetical protein